MCCLRFRYLDKLFFTEFVCYTGNGKYYTGLSSKTSSGLTCQRWSSQFPHQHNFKPSLYPDAKLNQNYCRNPLGTRSKPWCFTTAPNVTWEYCNISICDPPLDQKNPNVLGSKWMFRSWSIRCNKYTASSCRKTLTILVVLRLCKKFWIINFYQLYT